MTAARPVTGSNPGNASSSLVRSTNFLQAFDKIVQHVVKLLHPDRPSTDRQWGLCIFDDAIEFCDDTTGIFGSVHVHYSPKYSTFRCIIEWVHDLDRTGDRYEFTASGHLYIRHVTQHDNMQRFKCRAVH